MKETGTSITSGKDAMEVLDTLFDATELEYLRAELWYFLKAVVAEDHFRFRGQPVIACEVTEHFEQIIDVFDQLHDDAESQEIPVGNHAWKADGDLHYLMALRDIEEKFAGKIRRLRKNEIEDLNLVIEEFFQYQSAGDWKKELKNWQYYALSTGSICIASDDTSFLEMYEQLEKILEAAYLLHQRKSIQYRYIWTETGARIPTPGGPFLLSGEEFEDPMLFIGDYFGGTSLSEHTRELAHWIEAVFADKPWEQGPPSRLLYFHEEVCRLLEAGFALHAARASAAKDNYPKFLPPRASLVIAPRFLNDDEFWNPGLVLEQLYRSPLKKYNEELKNWLYHALSRSPIDDAECTLSTYHLLQKLSEALYVLCLRAAKPL